MILLVTRYWLLASKNAHVIGTGKEIGDQVSGIRNLCPVNIHQARSLHKLQTVLTYGTEYDKPQ